MKRKNDHKSIFKYQGSECPVCIEEMCVESRSVTSPCMHEFCLECIGKWLTESSSSLCPLCKQSVKVIIYNIQSPTKYSRINFPKGFNNAWQLRNKIKNILDNFENIIFKIYDTVRNFLFNKKKDFDNNILCYLIYFGNLQCRLKSSETNTYLPAIEISEDYKCWPEIEKLIRSRLEVFLSHEQLLNILSEINLKKIFTYSKLLNLLKRYLDEIRFNCIKLEIVLSLQKIQDPFAYFEYYVPGDYEHIIFTKFIFLDESVTAALITRIITSINIENLDFTIAGCQISNISQIFCLLEYLCSFEKLVSHLSFSAYYILLSTRFYTSINLKKPDMPLIPITGQTCNLIKHCFQKDELENITQTLFNFEKRLIYFEPFVVDDSMSSEESDGSFYTDDNNYLPQSDVYIELSDSDEDELEIVSVNRPVLDLTESVTDDELISDDSLILNNDRIVVVENIPKKKRKLSFFNDDEEEEELDAKLDFQRILGLYLSGNSEPTTSASVVETNTETNTDNQAEAIVAQTINSNPNEISERIDCLSDDDDDDDNDVINNKDVDFIYQPRSVNDFYEYLMSKNLPNS